MGRARQVSVTLSNLTVRKTSIEKSFFQILRRIKRIIPAAPCSLVLTNFGFITVLYANWQRRPCDKNCTKYGTCTPDKSCQIKIYLFLLLSSTSSSFSHSHNGLLDALAVSNGYRVRQSHLESLKIRTQWLGELIKFQV